MRLLCHPIGALDEFAVRDGISFGERVEQVFDARQIESGFHDDYFIS
jgi:hypothetical protein